MMVEITGTQIFGALITLLSMFGVMWLKSLDAEMKHQRDRIDLVQREIFALREEVTRDSRSYLRRTEMTEQIERIEAKIDRLADKLDAKQDRVS